MEFTDENKNYIDNFVSTLENKFESEKDNLKSIKKEDHDALMMILYMYKTIKINSHTVEKLSTKIIIVGIISSVLSSVATLAILKIFFNTF